MPAIADLALARVVAGLLVLARRAKPSCIVSVTQDTAPFHGSGATQSSSIGAAAWKLNVAHLAHTSDNTFRIDLVRSETDALESSPFPVTRIERAGGHWDADTSSSGTNYDLRNYLLRYLDAGWIAPL